MSKNFFPTLSFMLLTKQSFRQLPERRNTWCYTVILKKAVAIRNWLGCIVTVKQDNQFCSNLLTEINLIGLSAYAIKKEFLCMSATRYKFISVVHGRHIRSTNYIVLFPQTQITLLRYI